MAKLIPPLPVEDIDHEPEKDVARALVRTLGDDVQVFHSYPWLRPDRDESGKKRYLEEGEADFIVLHPRFGILDIEVKGGVMDYSPDEKTFYRMSRKGIRKRVTDPFEQGRRNIHALKDKIMEEQAFRSLAAAPFVRGYAAIFPDCAYESALPPGGDDEVIVWDERNLDNLGTSVEAAFRAWSRKQVHKPLPAGDLRVIKAALLPHFKLVPSLGRAVLKDESALVRLTDEQKLLIDFIGERSEALVSGVAGSGKTMLAIDAARRFAQEGLNTLFLCFNEPLAEDLRQRLGEIPRLTIKHFHSWCRQCCTQRVAVASGVRFDVPSKEPERTKFWEETSASLLSKAIDILKISYDAVVVDEGQDFLFDWWFPIDDVLHRQSSSKEQNKKLFIFFDPAQNLYEREVTFPITEKPYPLKVNCRNTKTIASFCRQVSRSPMSSGRLVPLGEEPAIHVAEGGASQRNAVSHILDGLTAKGGLETRQIAILTAPSVKDSFLNGQNRIEKHNLVFSLEQWKAGDGILVESAKRFKGLEADAVILAEVSGLATKYFSASDLYVASSRAKHRLHIVCSNPGLAALLHTHLKESRETTLTDTLSK